MTWFVITLVLLAFYWLLRKAKQDKNSEYDTQVADRSQKALFSFGAAPDTREKNIITAFEKKERVETFFEPDTWSPLIKLRFRISRHLASLSPKELTALRIAYLLYNRGLITAVDCDIIRLGIIWADGKGQIEDYKFNSSEGWHPKDISDAIRSYILPRGAGNEAMVSFAFACLEKSPQDHPTVRMLRRYLSGGGNAWLQPDEVESSPYAEQPGNPYRLSLGRLGEQSDGPMLTYSGEGAIITVAMPRAGKTQCQVLPNLVMWPGAALVLDVKGDLYPATKDWRSKNVGPVYRFAPLDPGNSHCFNPLTFVRNDPMNLWEDSRYLADMFVVRNADSKDKFWDERARDLLTAIIADTCRRKPPEERSMNRLHELANRIGWLEFIARLCVEDEINSMREEGHSLEKIEDKTLDGILQTLKVTLQPWAGQRTRETTKRSDWSPLDLRSATKPTIYLSLTPPYIDAFASVLRVFVALHIRALTTELPPRGAAPILFMLDEMPCLKYMPPIEEALATGLQYGVKLWMFAQSHGQLREAYRNADGMIGSCAVRCYMNPSLHDGTAEHLAKQLGERESPLDGKRELLVQAPELAGPDYKDNIICFSSGGKPVRLWKTPAYADPEINNRLGRETPEPTPT